MDIETAREYMLGLPVVTESFPFDETTLVFKVLDRMFALMDLEQPTYIALKCDPDYALELREQHPAIQGAHHFNKKYWNSVEFEAGVPDDLIRQLIRHSYDEVMKKFTRKQRQEYELLAAED
jgi:predicted DNA-binding protein (MmcQ/YjbR family)